MTPRLFGCPYFIACGSPTLIGGFSGAEIADIFRYQCIRTALLWTSNSPEATSLWIRLALYNYRQPNARKKRQEIRDKRQVVVAGKARVIYLL
jgi:hypothetical protein